MKKYYITTPIYYINDVPHIGHAYTTIAADVLARYHRAKGEDVFFLTGTDEHGAKIAEAAIKAGKEPKEFVDDLVPVFKEAWKLLDISYSEYFRTTDPRHEDLVQKFVKKLVENGWVEKRQYEGLYCVGCERFLKESELVDGKCPDHKREPIKQAEENYFFLLSKFSEQLQNLIESDELEIRPLTRKNEVLSVINQGLEDVSISRANVEWGIPFPDDSNQTIYVWVDALLNYYTATEMYGKKEFWPADLHLIGKEILRFHALIWPAMLLGLELPLPAAIHVNGHLTIGGQKMSKSLGNVIDPIAASKQFGADALRYALLREVPFGEDGDISISKIGERYKELGDTLGNLVQRTIVMMVKYRVERRGERGEGVTVISSETRNPAVRLSLTVRPRAAHGRGTATRARSKVAANAPMGSSRQPDDQLPQDDTNKINSDIENLQFSRALEKIMAFAASLNQLINEKAPWVLAKEGKDDEVASVLNQVYSGLVEIAQAALPFMPETASKMQKQLETLEPEPLFPRIEISS